MTRADSAVQPASEHFSGLVFKLQVGQPTGWCLKGLTSQSARFYHLDVLVSRGAVQARPS